MVRQIKSRVNQKLGGLAKSFLWKFRGYHYAPHHPCRIERAQASFQLFCSRSVCSAIISDILLVQVVLVVSIREPFSCLLLCSNHLFYYASEFFIVSRIFFAEILKLPPSHDFVRESFDYFSFDDDMYLSM